MPAEGFTSVYAYETHIYDDLSGKIRYNFPKGEVRDVPNDVALLLIGAHPTKLRRADGDDDAAVIQMSGLKVPAYQRSRAYTAPPETRAEPSPPEPVVTTDPDGDGRCTATTASGSRCKNADKVRGYCAIHTPATE